MKTRNLFQIGLIAFAMTAYTACGGNEDHGHDENGDHNMHMNSDSTDHMNSDGADHMHNDGADHMRGAHSAVHQCPMKCEGEITYAEAGKPCPRCSFGGGEGP